MAGSARGGAAGTTRVVDAPGPHALRRTGDPRKRRCYRREGEHHHHEGSERNSF
ncbi:MAG: hypothetical protein LJE84_03980 [Gammaproteobacteria bacterium]|nr:hypothetical protein [Gammaproteobacteria bacterium]